MNDYLLSVLLAMIEGLTEFLPVSSTAHLGIAESLLQVNLDGGFWEMYSIVIELGAVFAVPVYFRKRIANVFSTFPEGEHGDRTVLTNPLTLVLIAFVTTAIPSYPLTKLVGVRLESLTVMGTALLIGGIVMWFIDARNAKAERAGEAKSGMIHTWHIEDMSVGQALWIGICQIVSGIFPGTSRTMATVVGGQLTGISRSAALEFSLYLSIPTMVAAIALKLVRGKEALGLTNMDRHGCMVLAIGFVVSFAVAYGSLAWIVAWVKKRGFGAFAIYRIVVGIVVLFFASRLAV